MQNGAVGYCNKIVISRIARENLTRLLEKDCYTVQISTMATRDQCVVPVIGMWILTPVNQVRILSSERDMVFVRHLHVILFLQWLTFQVSTNNEHFYQRASVSLSDITGTTYGSHDVVSDAVPGKKKIVTQMRILPNFKRLLTSAHSSTAYRKLLFRYCDYPNLQWLGFLLRY